MVPPEKMKGQVQIRKDGLEERIESLTTDMSARPDQILVLVVKQEGKRGRVRHKEGRL